LIAHSLGTYFTGHILHEALSFRLHRVILTGCVLERTFPWGSLVRPAAYCFEVRNYVGGNDWVPFFTGLLRRLWLVVTWVSSPLVKRWPESALARTLCWRPLGSAGRYGFKENPSLSHAHRHRLPCPHCQQLPVTDQWAPIHSIISPFSPHSRMNKDVQFQRTAWLSALLGIAENEYLTWLDICQAGWEAHQSGDAGSLDAAKESLLTYPWNWPELINPTIHSRARHPLDWYVQRSLRGIRQPNAPVSLASIMEAVPLLIFENVAKAWKAAEQQDDQSPPSLDLRYFDPGRALDGAIREAVAKRTAKPSSPGDARG
jgi:hypothetical protein